MNLVGSFFRFGVVGTNGMKIFEGIKADANVWETLEGFSLSNGA